MPTARQAPAAGHVTGAKVGSELVAASAGNGGASPTPAARFQEQDAFTVPAASDCPTATQLPGEGQATSWISTALPADTPAGVGAGEALHVPEAKDSKRPWATPLPVASPAAWHVPSAAQATDSSCTSSEGWPPGVGAACAVCAPPDSESRTPS